VRQIEAGSVPIGRVDVAVMTSSGPNWRIGDDLDRGDVAQGNHHGLAYFLGSSASSQRAAAMRLEAALPVRDRERSQDNQLARPLIQRAAFGGRRLKGLMASMTPGK